MTKIQTLRGTLVRIKSGFEKVPRRIPKKQEGGGGQGDFEKNQTETDFFFGWLPLLGSFLQTKRNPTLDYPALYLSE